MTEDEFQALVEESVAYMEQAIEARTLSGFGRWRCDYERSPLTDRAR
jgi:hypothetical protein